MGERVKDKIHPQRKKEHNANTNPGKTDGFEIAYFILKQSFLVLSVL